MAKKEKKILKHPFYDRHTIPGAIALAALGMIISQFIIGGITGTLVTFIFIMAGTTDAREVTTIFALLGGTAGAFLVLALFRRWFYPEYEGGFKGGQRVPFWCLIGLPIIVIALIATIFIQSGKLGIPAVVSFATALSAGIVEEAVFRGMTASYLMRQWLDEKKIMPAIIVSSLLFGLIHGSNILAGAPIGMTIYQILFSIPIGCFMCTLFLRSGSLIPPMLFHVLWDIAAFMNVADISESGVYKKTAMSSLADKAVDFVFAIIFIGLTLYLTRPAVRDEISAIWKKKWNKNAG